jgi:hypothetical protein
MVGAIPFDTKPSELFIPELGEFLRTGKQQSARYQRRCAIWMS